MKKFVRSSEGGAWGGGVRAVRRPRQRAGRAGLTPPDHSLKVEEKANGVTLKNLDGDWGVAQQRGG
jgi:hypothetical protein